MLELYNIYFNFYFTFLFLFMKITLKTYMRIRLVIVFILAFIFSQSIIFENYIVPIFTMVIWSLFLLYLRSKVQEIIADERDYILAWKSAFLAIQIFSWISAILMFILYTFREQNIYFEVIAQVLAFWICFLMILYSLIFSIFNWWIKKWYKLIIILLLMLIFFITFFYKSVINYDNTNNNVNIDKIIDTNSWIIDEIDYRIEKNLDIDCNIDDDCETPMEYMVRSNCPYTSKCINKKCNVICPNY